MMIWVLMSLILTTNESEMNSTATTDFTTSGANMMQDEERILNLQNLSEFVVESIEVMSIGNVFTMTSYIGLIVLTICGNCLVIGAFFKDTTLQAITNYWIVSLAITDIILALTAMPLQAIKEFNVDKWTLGAITCHVFIGLDVLCCTCSIYHLGLISLDRFFCVRFPIQYPSMRTSQRTLLAIGLTWIWCTMLSFPNFLLGLVESANNITYSVEEFECAMTNVQYMIFSSLFSFYVPLILILCMYYGIYRATQARSKRFRREVAMSTRVRIEQTKSKTRTAEQGSPNALTVQTTLTTFPGNQLAAPVVADDEISVIQRSPLKGLKSEASTANGLDVDFDDSLDSSSESGRKPRRTAGRNRTVLCANMQSMFDRLFRHDTVVSSRSFASSGSGSAKTFSVKLTSNGRSGQTMARHLMTRFCGPPARSPQIQLEPTDTDVLDEQNPEQSTMMRDKKAAEAKKPKTIQSMLNRRRQKQEHRAAKVVVIVLAAFVVFWLPFFLVNIIEPACIITNGSRCGITLTTWKLVTLLGYCNSAINPFIYTFFNRTFRRAIFSLIKCERRRR